MTITERPANLSHSTDKIVQDGSLQPNMPPPQKAVLADVLKTLEQQLSQRGFLPVDALSSFNPLWYLAETERNVFLWKRGCSLIQQDEFEFWVDLEALIEKRLNQLQSVDGENPFLNPLWGVAAVDKESAEKEREYLLSFRKALCRIESHLNALSQVGSLLLQEYSHSQSGREKIILPAQKQR